MSDKKLYQQKLEAQLDEWKAELDKLKAKTTQRAADTRLDIGQKIKELEGGMQAVEGKLRELSGAGEDAWESLRSDLNNRWDALKGAFNDARGKLQDKE